MGQIRQQPSNWNGDQSNGFYTSYGKRYGRVADIIREHIPFTLILAGTANLFSIFYQYFLCIVPYTAGQGESRKIF